MRLSTFLLAIVAAFGGLGALSGPAQAVPTSIPYTGVLQVSGNNGNSPVDIQVRMFDSPGGNVQVWPAGNAVAAFPATPLRAGRFSINLGSANQPLDASVLGVEGRSVYLQITVNGTPLSPRQQLLAVPYALDAGSAAIRAEIAALRQEIEAARPTLVVGDANPGFRWEPGALPNFTRIPNGPTMVYTPSQSGTYRIHTYLAFLNTGGPDSASNVRMRGTGNGLGVLDNQIIGTNGVLGAVTVRPELVATLTAGTEYTFFVEVKSGQSVAGAYYETREGEGGVTSSRVVLERIR
jgi:hypothetical protein